VIEAQYLTNMRTFNEKISKLSAKVVLEKAMHGKLRRKISKIESKDNDKDKGE
jgi:hypothetical protein